MIRPTQADIWIQFAAAALTAVAKEDMEVCRPFDITTTAGETAEWAAVYADRMLEQFADRFEYNDIFGFSPRMGEAFISGRDLGDETEG